MPNFDLNNRILMFAICSSIEFDLRNFLINNPNYIDIPDAMLAKAKERNKHFTAYSSKTTDNDLILIELDMGDLVSLINNGAVEFGINTNQRTSLINIFDKIIPIRNKIMHTRPIEFSDRGILEETLHTIDTQLNFIEWHQLIKTREDIKNNPQQLIVETTFTPEIDTTTNIYHNLPVPEFDDTGYIGRKKEIQDLMKLIESDKNQIITVVGNGGIGKTATVVKCLYDLLDGPNNHNFEAIIWVSLKTKTLSKGEFRNINHSISELSDMYVTLQEATVKETENAEDDIINFMENFRTLLVIDNLETLPTIEIINFLKEVPSNSKVLITSRTGLGELENRYILSEMNQKDARQYFISLSLYYRLNLHEQNQKELNRLIKIHLYSSPLSIKWYITSIFFGANPIELLSNKNDLVEFSMSNIIENLIDIEIQLLWLLFVEGKALSYGEIDYYLDQHDKQVLIASINKLSATSMLKVSSNGKYEINSMAKDYLKKYRSPSTGFVVKISQRRNMLNSLLQEIKTKNEADPFNPKSLFSNLKDENTKISSFYLLKALEHSAKREWDKAFDMIKKAEGVAPDYFEVYKIRGFINAENNNLMDAIESYRIAIENANSDEEKGSVYYLFSVFYTIKLKDYIAAKECIEKAEEYLKNEPVIITEKGRVYMYLGEYEQALNILQNVDTSKINTDKFLNQYESRIAELYRRIAGNYDNRDTETKSTYLSKALDEINKLNHVDNRTCVILLKILIDLTYILSTDETINLFTNNFRRHLRIIQNNTSASIKKLRNNVSFNQSILPDDVIKSSSTLGLSFNEQANAELDHSKGIIVKLMEHYGFIKNHHGSYYFRLKNLEYDNPSVGDRVSFDLIYNSSKNKNNAINVKKID